MLQPAAASIILSCGFRFKGFFAPRPDGCTALFIALTLAGYFSSNRLAASPPLAEQEMAGKTILKAMAILSSKGVDSRQRSRAFADYRRAVLPFLTNRSFGTAGQSEFFDPGEFAEIPLSRNLA